MAARPHRIAPERTRSISPARTIIDHTAPRPSTRPAEPWTVEESERNQRLNIAEGSFNAVSVGLTAAFIVPFALLLGASSTLIALLTTVPNLVGAFAQLWVQRVRDLFDTRRQHMFVFSFIQALTWLPLLFIHSLPHPQWWLLAIVTINATGGFLIGPVWNSFTADIVPERERGRFFGLRNTATGVCAFVATVIAGGILNWLKPTNPYLGFILLFLLAFGFRLSGALLFLRMGKPPEATPSSGSPAPHELLLHAERTPFGRFTLFVTLFYVAVYLASPFFPMYQLSVLGWSYARFTLFACISAITSFLTMFIWGKFVDRLGARVVLLTAGLTIPLVPLLWAATTDLRVLALAEVLSGASWAAFGLSVSTYLFDATDRSTRTRRVAEYTLLIQLASFIGAILGGLVLSAYAKTAQAYLNVFFLSAALRFIVVIAFIGVVIEQRLVEVPIKGRLYRRFVAIRPSHGVEYETAMENRIVAQQRREDKNARIARRRH